MRVVRTRRNAWIISALATTLLLATSFLASLGIPLHAAQTIPYKVNFQGRLTDNNGNILPDGSYNIKFRLWTALSGGSNSWEEDRVMTGVDNRIQVTNGLFNIQFGDLTALTTTMFGNGTYPLYVEVELPTPATATCNTNGCASFTEGAMTPRQALASAPYAFNSDTLDGLDSAAFGQLGQSQTWTGTNTFAPTTNISSAIVKQNSSGSFGQDVFAVQGSSSGNFIQITSTAANAGAVTVQSLGGSNALNLDAAGALNVGASSASAINLGRTGLGVAIPATGVVAVSLTGIPAASTSSSLLQLTAAIAGGSSGGTYVGANPSSFSGDFANFQVNGNNVFKLGSFGDITTGFTAVAGSTTTNGSSGLGTSTSMVLTSAASFTVGNYVVLDNNGAACAGGVAVICYAKITAKATNTLTISPALKWSTGRTVTQAHIPEVGSSTLTNRYGQAYFINGVTTGNGSTDYTDGAINSTDTSFDLLNTGVTTLNIGGAATTLGLGSSGATISIPGNLSVTGTISGTAPATGTSGYFQRSGTNLSPATTGDNITTSGSISTSGSGTVTSAGAISAPTSTNTINNLVINGGSLSNVGANITGAAAVTLASGSSSALNLTGSAASTWDIGNNLLSLQATNNGAVTIGNGAVTTGTGLVTHGGNLTFSGTAARTITGPATGGLTINTTSGPLTLSTTTSGPLGISSAGALNLTGATASGFSTTAGNLTLQGGSGTVSLGTSTMLTASGALTLGTGSGDLAIDPTGNTLIKGSTSTTGTAALDIQNTTTSILYARNDGNVGIGTAAPNNFKLEVAGNIGPDADNTRDLGSSARHFANIYANNLIEKSVTFTPTTAGWYRIASGVNMMGGTIRISAPLYDSTLTDVEIQYNISGFAQTGSIQQTRYSSFNNGVVSAARTSTDGAATLYLDIFVSSATVPQPITIYGYGPNQPAFVSSPVVGAVAGASSVNLLTLGAGFRSTQGANFAETGGNVGIGLSGAASQLLSVGGTTGNLTVDGSGNLSTSGNQTFSGVAAKTITGPTTGGLTVTVASGPLSLTTTTSGTLSVSSAGALSLTGAAPSTWDIGNNTLSLQTTNNGAITTGNGAFTTGSGLVTHGGNLTFSGTAARTITGPTTGGLSVTVASGPLSLSTTTAGALSLSSAAALNLTGAAPSSFDIGNNTLSLQTTGNGAITTGTGLLTQGGNMTFSGTAARTITAPTTGGLTINTASGPLTLSTTTSGTLAVTSAGALNLTGASPSTWDIGNNLLSLQTTNNGAITTGNGAFTTGTGLVTHGGNLTFSGTAARTITGPATGGLTITAASAPLTLSTTTSGTLAVTSAGALNLTGAAASSLDVGNNLLSIQATNNGGITTGNGAFTTGTGLVTHGGNLTFSGTAARIITGPSTGGLTATVVSGPLTLSTTTSGALTLNSAGALNITGALPSTWDIGNNLLSLQTTSNGGITTGSGLLTQGGNLTFSGASARTITGPATGGLTMNVTTGPLTVSTTTSGILAVTSAGALNLTGSAASTFDIGNNTLSVQTIGNGAITTGVGLVTHGGDLAVNNRNYVPATTSTNGQGYFIRNSTPTPIAAFQALDLGGNTYSFLTNNKYYNGTAWVDAGLGRTGSSFQIQNDSFAFYSFDTGTTFTPRLAVATGGNVGVGTAAASPQAVLHVGTAATTYNTYTGIDGTSATLGGAFLEQTVTTSTFTNPYRGSVNKTIANFSSDPGAKSILGGYNEVGIPSGNAVNQTSLVLRANNNVVTHFGTGTLGTGAGLVTAIKNMTSGTITDAIALQAQIQNQSTGIITNAYGLQVSSLSNTSGTINNTYGVYVGDMSVGTQTNTPYSFYASDANALNFFAGSVNTSGGLVVGSATTDATQINLQLDSFSTFADSGTCNATTNQGAIYYNTNTNAVRGCINSAWEDLVTTGGLGIIAYGVVLDSGSQPGDLQSLVGGSGVPSGPCQPYWKSATAIAWTGCVVYSGGRKVIIAANSTGLTTTNAVAGQFQHLCLTAAGNQPALSTAGTETANLPTWSANNPIVCLADVKFAGANNTITNIYDTRVFSNSSKQFVYTTVAMGLDYIAVSNNNQVTATATAGVPLEGVIVASNGAAWAAGSGGANAIMVMGGPVFVKTTAALTLARRVQTTTTTGYATSVAFPTAATITCTTGLGAGCTPSVATNFTISPYTDLGVNKTTSAAASACSATVFTCGSALVDVEIR